MRAQANWNWNGQPSDSRFTVLPIPKFLMLAKFETYQLSLELYRECQKLTLPHHLKDQLSRASLSICLNLAEGSAKPSIKEKRRFYAIAFGSCREVQTVIELEKESTHEIFSIADQVAAHLYRLCR